MNSSNSPFSFWPRSVAIETRTSRSPAAVVKEKPHVTPRASWGTRNGRTAIPPMENVSPSENGRTGPRAGERGRTFRANPSRLPRCRWIGTSCLAQQATADWLTWSLWRWDTRTASTSSHPHPASARAAESPRWEGSPASTSRIVPACETSVRFPEEPLRRGVTWKSTFPPALRAYRVKTQSCPLTFAWLPPFPSRVDRSRSPLIISEPPEGSADRPYFLHRKISFSG